ncbi:MAG: phosphate signaling complex protein PhoU [Macromonas sp.]
MPEKHLSSQFDVELGQISTLVMQMGGMVESQLHQAIYALQHLSPETADQVLVLEDKVDRMEIEIDREISSVIGRRQPTARDLRLLIGVSKTTANLERAGDEATRIARMVKSIIDSGMPRSLPTSELRLASELATGALRKSLDAFARLDVEASLDIIKDDLHLDAEYDGFLRKLITYMMEDPRTISPSLNLLFLAKAVERIGDHAKNIAEATIYIVRGADVRHTTPEQREAALQ